MQSNMLDKIAKFLQKITEILCSTVLMIMIFLVVLGVFFRYVVGSSLPWVVELTRYFLIGIGFIGAALAFQREEHVSISYVYDKLPHKITYLLDILRTVLIFYYGYVLIKAGIIFADTGSRGLFTNIPGFYPRMIIPVSGFLLIVFTINKTQTLFKRK